MRGLDFGLCAHEQRLHWVFFSLFIYLFGPPLYLGTRQVLCQAARSLQARDAPKLELFAETEQNETLFIYFAKNVTIVEMKFP